MQYYGIQFDQNLCIINFKLNLVIIFSENLKLNLATQIHSYFKFNLNII